METKNFNFDFEVKTTNDMEFEGYGSIFGNVDSYRDIVVKGAFNRTIKNNKNRIKILWQHDSYEPIGRPVEIYEDEKGLYLKAKLCNTDIGKKAYELMKEKVLDEMSIGYQTLVHEYDKEKDIRYLKEVKLFEVSVVTWAANEKAKINDVKFEDLLMEIKSGNILKNASKDKILEAIKALTALIDSEMDPSKDTPLVNDSQQIKNTNSDILDLVLARLKSK